MFALERLQKEYKLFELNPLEFASCYFEQDKPLIWYAFIQGPENSPYQGGLFQLKFTFPEEYPFKPPKVEYLNQIYSPTNDLIKGQVVIPELNKKWHPALTTSHIL